MPPKRTEKNEGIPPSQGKGHRSQEEETDADGRSVERLVHKFEEEAVKEGISFSGGEGLPANIMLSMEKNICGDIKEMTKTFTVVMKEFMTEIREWRKSSKEDNKSPKNDKPKETGTKLSEDQGQGSGNSQTGENRRLEESPTLGSVEEEKYTPPHMREYELDPKRQSYSNGKQVAGNMFAVTSPSKHSEMYGDGGMLVCSVPGSGNNTRGANYSPHPLRKTRVLDSETVHDVIQQLYGPGVRPFNRPEFHKPYPDVVARENPYPRGYHISDFTLYSGEDRQSNVEYVAMFTIQCGELANLDNFSNYKLRLFPNSLTSTAFIWYATLPRKMMFEVKGNKTETFHGKGCCHSGDDMYYSGRNMRYSRGSMAKRPENQHLGKVSFHGSMNGEGRSDRQSFQKLIQRPPPLDTDNRHERKSRFVIPPRAIPNGVWKRVEHPKFPKLLSRTQKRRLLREKAVERRSKVEESFKQKKIFEEEYGGSKEEELQMEDLILAPAQMKNRQPETDDS